MAPELMEYSDLRLSSAKVEDFIKADVWSYGMLLHTLMNPDKEPFVEEAASTAFRDAFERNCVLPMSQMYNASERPSMDKKYETLRSTQWQRIMWIHCKCTSFDRNERPAPEEIVSYFEYSPPTVMTLDVSQNSARIQADAEYAERMDKEGDSAISMSLANDGSNACAFLALTICSKINSAPDSDIQCLVKESITSFPSIVNPFRSESQLYDVYSANEIINKNECWTTDWAIDALEEILTSQNDALSPDGMRALVCGMEKIEGQAIFTCGGLVFAICKSNDEVYLVDTHQVPTESGGDLNGVVVRGSAQDICAWLWKRLRLANKDVNSQSLVVPKYFKVKVQQSNVFKVPFPPKLVTKKKQATPPLEEHQKLQEEFDTVASKTMSAVNWTDMPVNSFKGHPYAVATEKLSNFEIYQGILSSFPTCKSVPQACRRNSIFFIDTSNLKHLDDVKSDMNGVFHDTLDTRRKKVRPSPTNLKLEEKHFKGGKSELTEGSYAMSVNRRRNKAGLVRHIAYFTDNSGKILQNKICLQYYVDVSVAGVADQVDFTVNPHGNAGGSKAFHPIKKSTLEGLKDLWETFMRKLTNPLRMPCTEISHVLGNNFMI